MDKDLRRGPLALLVLPPPLPKLTTFRGGWNPNSEIGLSFRTGRCCCIDDDDCEAGDMGGRVMPFGDSGEG